MKQLFFNQRTRRYYYQYTNDFGKRIQFSCQTGDKKLAVQFVLDKMASPIGRPSVASGLRQQVTGSPIGRPSFSSQRDVHSSQSTPRLTSLATNTATTLAKFAEEYLETMKARYSPNTVVAYEESLRQLKRRLGEHIPMKDITVKAVEKFVYTGQPSLQTAARHYRTLSAIFQKAVKWKTITSNPFLEVDKPILLEQDADFMTEEEFELLLAAMPVKTRAQKTMRNIFIIAFETAVRCGEVRNIRKTAIDFENHNWAIKNRPTFRTKSGKQRTVPLSSRAMQAINEQLELNEGMETEFLFPGRIPGKPLSGKHVSRDFKNFIRKVFGNDRPGLHFHSIRHSTAKKAHKKNVPVLELQQIMGHSTVRLTERYGYSQRTSFPGYEQAFN